MCIKMDLRGCPQLVLGMDFELTHGLILECLALESDDMGKPMRVTARVSSKTIQTSIYGISRSCAMLRRLKTRLKVVNHDVEQIRPVAPDVTHAETVVPRAQSRGGIARRSSGRNGTRGKDFARQHRNRPSGRLLDQLVPEGRLRLPGHALLVHRREHADDAEHRRRHG